MKGEPATVGGNRLFLVCTACGADTASAFELGMSHTAEYDVPKAPTPIDTAVHQAGASA